jgi:DNA repair exonuclease SbcCD ATPase subunit
MISETTKKITNFKTKLNRAEGRLSAIQSDLEKEKFELKSKEIRQVAVEEAHVFLQKVAKDTQEHLKFHIEDIVNLAINTIVPEKYDFKVAFEIKRGQTEADIHLLKDGNQIDIMSGSGGGVVDIVAFALRIAAWTLSKTDNVIILDEPFRFISKNLQPKAGEMLRALSHRLKVQFIIVTHNAEIVDISDRIFEVTQKDGVSMINAHTITK